MPLTTTRSRGRPVRTQKYPYRRNPLWPNERVEGPGELVQDCISMFWFPKVHAVQGPFGLVDGRDGNTLDTDVPNHEAPITMVGSYFPPRSSQI